MAWKWSSTETPHPAVAHQTVKFSWHCHQSKGVVFKEFQALFAIAISPVSGGFWYWAKMSGKEAWKSPPSSSTIIFWLARDTCFSLKWPHPICCRAFERVGPLVRALGHYVRHTHRHSKWGTGLSCICSRDCVWGLEVALCELTYYHRWLNIGAELGNNISDGRTVFNIPDGYCNVCELDKEAFRPLRAELRLHAPTGRLQISSKKRLVLNRGLAKLLGFSRETFELGHSHIADEPHRLTIHREICVHLAEVSTSENLHNGRPSTLLKSVPVDNGRCGGGRTETFPVLQYKRLVSGPLS